jgi:hypothetical protein
MTAAAARPLSGGIGCGHTHRMFFQGEGEGETYIQEKGERGGDVTPHWRNAEM